HEEGDRGENQSDVPHRSRSCQGLLTGTHECVRDAHVPPGTRGKSIDALLECAIRRLRYSRACAGATYPQTCSRRTLRRDLIGGLTTGRNYGRLVAALQPAIA